MKKWKIEALVVLPLTILSVGKGIQAIISETMWLVPKHSPQIYLTGLKAQLGGLGYIGLGLMLVSAWGISAKGKSVFTMIGLALAIGCIVGGFGGSAFLQ